MEFFGVKTHASISAGIVLNIIHNIDEIPDLLQCLVLNKSWHELVLPKLYRGSLNDAKLRTRDIGSLNCLLVASRERFKKHMRLIDHLLLSPEEHPLETSSNTEAYRRMVCLEECRALRKREDSELLWQGYEEAKGFLSLAIPFQFKQRFTGIADLFFHTRMRSLTMDIVYCDSLMATLDRPDGKTKSESTVTTIPLMRDEASKLQDILRGYRKLKSLALMLGKDRPVGMMFAAQDMSDACVWPDMPALRLQTAHESWLKALPGFTKLQVLIIWNEDLWDDVDVELLLDSLTRCPQLETLEIPS